MSLRPFRTSGAASAPSVTCPPSLRPNLDHVLKLGMQTEDIEARGLKGKKKAKKTAEKTNTSNMSNMSEKMEFLARLSNRIEKFKNMTNNEKRVVTYWPYAEGENENAKYGKPYDELYDSLMEIDMIVSNMKWDDVTAEMMEKGPNYFITSKLKSEEKELLIQINSTQDAN